MCASSWSLSTGDSGQPQVEEIVGGRAVAGWARRSAGRSGRREWGRQLVQPLRPGQRQDGQRRLVHQVGRVGQRRQRRRVGPLHVVEHDQQRAPPRQPGQQPPHGRVNSALVRLRAADEGLGRGLAAHQVEQHRADLVRQRA